MATVAPLEDQIILLSVPNPYRIALQPEATPLHLLQPLAQLMCGCLENITPPWGFIKALPGVETCLLVVFAL